MTPPCSIVGDIDQLPSVGAGQVLADIISVWRRSGGATDRGVPAGGNQQDHHGRAQDQQGHDA